MEAAKIIDLIERFFNQDNDIQNLFDYAVDDNRRYRGLQSLERKISRLKECDELGIGDIFVPNSIGSRDGFSYQHDKIKDPTYTAQVNIDLFNDSLSKIISKEAAISEFNKLISELLKSPFLVWLEQECSLSLVINKLKKKNLAVYMPYHYRSAPFKISDSYLTVLLARVISKPLFNYLNVPKKLPSRATFQKVGRLAEGLLSLVDEYKELMPWKEGDVRRFKTMLSQIGIDHITKTKPHEFTVPARNKSSLFQRTEKVFIRPRESLKEIRYEELKKHKLKLLIEDMGIIYIDTFSLHSTTKGRPHSEIILDLIPQSCVPLDEMPDDRTVQRWLKNLDGHGATVTERSAYPHRPFLGDGNTFRQLTIPYVRRLITKPIPDDPM
jgi:hypothetical protein